MTLEDLLATVNELRAQVAELQAEVAAARAGASGTAIMGARMGELIAALNGRQEPPVLVTVQPADVNLPDPGPPLPPITGIKPEWVEGRIVYMTVDRSGTLLGVKP